MSLPPNYTGSESLLAGGQGAAPPIVAMRGGGGYHGGGIRWANNNGGPLEAVRYFKGTEPAEAFENNEPEYISLDDVIGPLPNSIRGKLKLSMRKYIMDIQGEYFIRRINREDVIGFNADDEDILESFVDTYNEIKGEEEGEVLNPISGADESIRTLKPKLVKGILDMVKLQIASLKKYGAQAGGAAAAAAPAAAEETSKYYIGPLPNEIVFSASELANSYIIKREKDAKFIPKVDRAKTTEEINNEEDILDGMVGIYNNIRGEKSGMFNSPITGKPENIRTLKNKLGLEVAARLDAHAKVLKRYGAMPVAAPAPAPAPAEETPPPAEPAEETPAPAPVPEADEYSNAAIRERLAPETKAKFTQALNIYGDKYDLNSAIEYQYSHKPLKRFLADYGIGPDYQDHTDAIIRAFFTVFPNPSSGEAVASAIEMPEFHIICAFLQYRILTLRFEIQLTMRSTERRTALEQIVKRLQNLLKGSKCGSVNTALAIETMKSKEAYDSAMADVKTPATAKLANIDGKLNKILTDLATCCEKLNESLKPGGTFSTGMVDDIRKIIGQLKIVANA